MSKAYAFLIQNEFIPRQTLHKLGVSMKEISQKNNLTFDDVTEINLSIIQNTRVGIYGKCAHGVFYPIIHSDIYNVMNRFALAKRYLDNPFVDATRKEAFLCAFSTIQCMYRGFSKLAQVYRCKRAILQVSHDMYWSPIEETNINTMCVMCHGSRYLFKLCDIVNLFVSAITNMEYNIAEPLPLKNPYTNEYFRISNLYNMYFFIRSRLCQVPILIQNFFMLEFNITKYSMIHKTMIQDVALEQSAKYTDGDTVYNDIVDMIEEYSTRRRTFIDSRFPKNIMVNAFHPYLVFYYKSKYSRHVEMNVRHARFLENQLDCFFRTNPRFGEVYAESVVDGVPVFNTTYTDFTTLSSNVPDQYLESHLYTRLQTMSRVQEPEQYPTFTARQNTRTPYMNRRTNNYRDDDSDDTEDMNSLSTPSSTETNSDIDNIYNADMYMNNETTTP